MSPEEERSGLCRFEDVVGYPISLTARVLT